MRTFVACAADPCVVNGAGDTHRVRVTSDSPLPYRVALRSRCTDGVTFVNDGVLENVWAEDDVYVPARRRSRPGRTEAGRARDVDRRLIALRRRDDEAIEVAVSWSCIGHSGAGDLRPSLVLQVDARAATP
ncbi:hypothetical protein AB0M20_38695 [Actinoplanes sp. NPDC051633]|uniref:hypothetical protein n=1 Tax=Actinoplanes sp. NPDC051633 TaxID=3155670 RepID=UPI00343E9CD7